jgi:myo-inositol-hexaphosphate 3-phosphohydrolase
VRVLRAVAIAGVYGAAVWVHPTNPSRSLILGTDKAEEPNGALYVFDLSGRVVNRPSR